MAVERKYTVNIYRGDELYITLIDPKFYPDGRLKGGWVSNGAWPLDIDKDGQWWAGRKKVSSPEFTNTLTIERDYYLVDTQDRELWGSDPTCDHSIVPQRRGGIICTKCGGWFCY